MPWFYILATPVSHFRRSQLDSHIYICIQSVAKAPILYLWKTPVYNHEWMGMKKANNILGLIINSFDLIGSLKKGVRSPCLGSLDLTLRTAALRHVFCTRF